MPDTSSPEFATIDEAYASAIGDLYDTLITGITLLRIPYEDRPKETRDDTPAVLKERFKTGMVDAGQARQLARECLRELGL